MSKYAKRLPQAKIKAQWLSEGAVDWENWENRISIDTGRGSFHFDSLQRSKINDAIQLLERNPSSAITIEKAKSEVRKMKAILEEMNLPDSILLDARERWKPSAFLMDMGFSAVSPIFEQAMLDTSEEGQKGMNVSKRLGKYLSRMRVGDSTIDGPRPEAIAAFCIQEVFEACDLPVNITHTRHISSGEGNETLSVFEVFTLEHIFPNLGTDDSARKVLDRRLKEAIKYVHRAD